MNRKASMVAALLALGLGAMPPARPTTAAPVRSPADIARRKAKQAAKLARRAARAGHKASK